jgi:hypothetical protein
MSPCCSGRASDAMPAMPRMLKMLEPTMFSYRDIALTLERRNN